MSNGDSLGYEIPTSSLKTANPSTFASHRRFRTSPGWWISKDER